MDQLLIGLLFGILVGAGVIYAVLNANFKRILETRSSADTEIREAAQREAETIRREAEAVKLQASTLREKAESDAARIKQDAELRARDDAQAFQNKLESELKAKFELEATRERENIKADRETVKADREALKSERDGLRSEREELRLEGERFSRRGEQLDTRAAKLDQLEDALESDKKRNGELQQSLEQKIHESELKLYEVAQLTREAAAKQILEKLDDELEEEKVDENGMVRIHTVVLSAQHDDNIAQEKIHEDIKREVIIPIMGDVIDENTIFHINPTGNFVIG